jgi:tRNA (cytidine/uridine-2'-O-)-methyltransferase
MLPPHALKLVLVEPEIPHNAGNIARLCAATGTALHLVRPLGFILSDKHFRRAGMDYLQHVSLTAHNDLASLFQVIGADPVVLTSGLTGQNLWSARFAPHTWIFLGKESAGLPQSLLNAYPTIQIPMQPHTRGLNLATAAGIVLYDALRQLSAAL